MKYLATAAVIFTAVLTMDAQSTVTNEDLAKFREKRLAAEKRYRENYQRLGMPSPEEIEKRRTEDIAATLELAAELRRDRQEMYERQLRAALAMERYAERDPVYIIREGSGYGGGLIYDSGYFYGRRGIRGRHFGRGFPQTYYRAGGGGVIYEPGGRSSYVYSAPIAPRIPLIRRAPVAPTVRRPR